MMEEAGLNSGDPHNPAQKACPALFTPQVEGLQVSATTNSGIPIKAGHRLTE